MRGEAGLPTADGGGATADRGGLGGRIEEELGASGLEQNGDRRETD